MKDFVHLHLHSHYSLLDGAIKIDDIINKSIEFNMPSVAVTDHGNMFGAIEFYEKAAKNSIKPIIGCELYVAKSDMKAKNVNEKRYNHLILLAKNDEGYRNLSRLVSMSYIDGFYYKPRIDKNLLKSYHKGLIALSACIKGEIPWHIVQGRFEAAEESLKYYLDLFGEDFYLEMQVQGIEEQKTANKGLIELAGKYGVPLVATNDCHYLLKEDYEAHDVLLCIQTGKTVEDKDRMRFSTKDLYFRSQEEMNEIFSEYPSEAISNTTLIASKCNFSFNLKGGHYFPQFKPEDAVTQNAFSVNDYFEKEAREGFEGVFVQKPTKAAAESYSGRQETYRQRLDMEIDVIKKSNFAGYFLIVSDFIKYAKEHNIPVGPGRGSAAGSLVAYCLKITEIDPIKYDLMFERFLNPERISMPDIDSDFCINGRDEVIRYVAGKYGEEQVSQIITFGTMLAKAVIRDTGRALNMPYAEVDKIAKLVPNTLGITLDEAIEEEKRLKDLINADPKVKKLIEIARRLEGLARHASTHAAGVVISNEPIYGYMPLYKGTKETDVITTQYTGTDLEKLGFIKFDFLGLKTLTVMNEAISLINDLNTGAGGDEAFNIYDIDLNDRATLRLLSAGDTTGVFQLESSGMKELVKKLLPNSFDDLIPLVALYRPGPLGSGMVDDFIKARHGKTKRHYIHPSLKDILQDTYGVILYQEQIMKIATNLAGFSMGEADVLRKGVGKKKAELINEMKDKFISGCETNGIDKTKSEKIFSLITKFGEYGFNKSHSTAYAYIAYMTAYLKANYKDHFTAALLSSEMSNTDKLAKIINEVKSGANPCEVLPPSVNHSTERFTIVKKEGGAGFIIRTGLGGIKNVGKAAIDSILETRKDKPFKNISDFCSRVDTRKVNKRTIENLIKSGAMDTFGDTLGKSRKWMLDNLESVMEDANFRREKNNSGQFELPLAFGKEAADGEGEGGYFLPDSGEKDDKKSILAFEKESLGFYLSGHPLDGYEEKIKLIGAKDVMDIVTDFINAGGKPSDSVYKMCGVINQLKMLKTKNNDKMASFVLNDNNTNVQVVFFPRNYIKCEDIINTNEPVILTGKVDFSGLNVTDAIRKKEAMNNGRQEGSEAGACRTEDKYDKTAAGAEGANALYETAEEDIDLNIKVIGEDIQLLDSFKIKNQEKSRNDLCIIEIDDKTSFFDVEEFKILLSDIKGGFASLKGGSRVLLKTSGYHVLLNDDITVDKSVLKSKPIPGYLNIL